jgi:hypothetical protein
MRPWGTKPARPAKEGENRKAEFAATRAAFTLAREEKLTWINIATRWGAQENPVQLVGMQFEYFNYFVHQGIATKFPRRGRIWSILLMPRGKP